MIYPKTLQEVIALLRKEEPATQLMLELMRQWGERGDTLKLFGVEDPARIKKVMLAVMHALGQWDSGNPRPAADLLATGNPPRLLSLVLGFELRSISLAKKRKPGRPPLDRAGIIRSFTVNRKYQAFRTQGMQRERAIRETAKVCKISLTQVRRIVPTDAAKRGKNRFQEESPEVLECLRQLRRAGKSHQKP